KAGTGYLVPAGTMKVRISKGRYWAGILSSKLSMTPEVSAMVWERYPTVGIPSAARGWYMGMAPTRKLGPQLVAVAKPAKALPPRSWAAATSASRDRLAGSIACTVRCNLVAFMSRNWPRLRTIGYKSTSVAATAAATRQRRHNLP